MPTSFFIFRLIFPSRPLLLIRLWKIKINRIRENWIKRLITIFVKIESKKCQFYQHYCWGAESRLTSERRTEPPLAGKMIRSTALCNLRANCSFYLDLPLIKAFFPVNFWPINCTNFHENKARLWEVIIRKHNNLMLRVVLFVRSMLIRTGFAHEEREISIDLRWFSLPNKNKLNNLAQYIIREKGTMHSETICYNFLTSKANICWSRCETFNEDKFLILTFQHRDWGIWFIAAIAILNGELI